MPSATWADERCASMRYIAKSYMKKKESANARKWYLRAIAEAPHLREPYVDFAKFLYEEKDWDGVVYFTKCALEIKNRPISYICESEAWGSMPWDLNAIGLFYTGRAKEALVSAKKACEMSPNDERLKKNAEIIEKNKNG